MSVSMDYYASERSDAPDLLLRVVELDGNEIIEVWRDGAWVEDLRLFKAVYSGDLVRLSEQEASKLISGRAAA